MPQNFLMKFIIFTVWGDDTVQVPQEKEGFSHTVASHTN